jgi:hypothetical protein
MIRMISYCVFSICICELNSYACLRVHCNGVPHMRKRMNKKMAIARAAGGARGGHQRSSRPVTYDDGSGACGHSSRKGGVVGRSLDAHLTRPPVVTIWDDSPECSNSPTTAKDGIPWHHPTNHCQKDQPVRKSARVAQMEMDKDDGEIVREIFMILPSPTGSDSTTLPWDGSDDRSMDFEGM